MVYRVVSAVVSGAVTAGLLVTPSEVWAADVESPAPVAPAEQQPQRTEQGKLGGPTLPLGVAVQQTDPGVDDARKLVSFDGEK